MTFYFNTAAVIGSSKKKNGSPHSSAVKIKEFMFCFRTVKWGHSRKRLKALDISAASRRVASIVKYIIYARIEIIYELTQMLRLLTLLFRCVLRFLIILLTIVGMVWFILVVVY